MTGDSYHPHLTSDDERLLLTAASDAIAAKLLDQPSPDPTPAPGGQVDESGASFVTLRADDRLLGCIGSLEPRRSLREDVAANAVAAAFDDPRLPPLTTAEFTTMSITVSVLSPLVPLESSGYDELTVYLHDHRTGLLVTAGNRRATFLPAVWRDMTTTSQFVDALWDKAGLRARAWPRDLRVWRYAAIEVTDAGPRSLQ
jgi:AmmeMemoRadiSam system protein A